MGSSHGRAESPYHGSFYVNTRVLTVAAQAWHAASMPIKTSQLQIRVTEEEKAALKRLARAANLSVSRYVLAQALPSRPGEIERLLDALGRPGADIPATLDQIQRVLAEAPADGVAGALGHPPPLERLEPVHRNRLAATVEQVAYAHGVDPPAWVANVAPLSRPHFGWSLASLQPHQIRVTPVPFKRRGLFFDPATRPAVMSGSPLARAEEAGTATWKLLRLAELLVSLELKAEFYFLGGAILFHTFHARPGTAHIDALLRAPVEASDAAADLGRREGWEPGWLRGAVKEVLHGGRRPDRYFEAGGLAVFVPAAEYVLAVKVASLRLGAGTRTLDDLRYVLRGLNLVTPDDALEIAGRYLGERQLPADAREVLRGLLAP